MYYPHFYCHCPINTIRFHKSLKKMNSVIILALIERGHGNNLFPIDFLSYVKKCYRSISRIIAELSLINQILDIFSEFTTLYC